jgi:NAD(P)H-hydrate epimerase
MQLGVPEAMALTDNQDNFLETLPAEIEKYTSVGIGPGIGQAEQTQKLLSFLLRRYHGKLILDADALNILSGRKEWLQQIPPGSILTPHPKEFDRLAGPHDSDFQRMESAKAMAGRLGVTIVLKGHHTLVAHPDGKMHFNMSGNPGMAKGGSGDVLTGIITSLAGQNYSPSEAALLGVYLHGLAGDIAAGAQSEESMTPGDLVEALGKAFLELRELG